MAAAGRSFRRGLRLAWEANRKDFVVAALLCAVAAAATPVEIWLGKRIVDLITIDHHTASDALPFALALGIVFGLNRALGPFRNAQQQEFGELVQLHVTRTFLTKAATVDLGYLDNPRWHDAASRARRDIPWMPAHLTTTTFELVASIAGTLAMLGLVAGLHPVLGVLLLASIAPWVVLQRQTNRLLFEYRTGQSAADRERMYVSSLLAEPPHAKDVRSYGLATHLVDRYTRLSDEVLAQHGAIMRRSRWLAIVSALVTAGAVGIAYQFVAVRGLAGTLTPGALTAMIAAFTAIASQGNALAHLFGQMGRQLAFLDDYFMFLDMPTLLPLRKPPLALPGRLDGGVRFDGVRFAYPGAEQEALAGIDLEVRPGELIAIVGENGAGKTTLVNLLSRFYDPTGGRVTIGGIDLKDADPVELRARIGTLLQDFARYELTMRDNVHLGRIDRAAHDGHILDAIDAARARAVLEALPEGLDTRLGRLFDGGHELSGGQWQRLAVARLMYRSADLWILDEPTSNLDPEAEAAIFAELKAQLAGRMAIVISHRFSTVRVADRIYVIERGRVLENGTHDELIAARGRYAELFELQAAGYR